MLKHTVGHLAKNVDKVSSLEVHFVALYLTIRMDHECLGTIPFGVDFLLWVSGLEC